MLSEMIIPKKRTRELALDQKQLYAIGLSHAQKLSNQTTYPEGTLDFLKQNYKNLNIVDPQILKKELNNVKVLNVALLGALSKMIDISDDSWIKAIRELVPAGTEELNIKAFEAGKQLLSY